MATADTLSSLADHLKDRRATVLAGWRELAERDPDLTTANRLTRLQFNDHIPHALDALDRILRGERGGAGGEAATEHVTVPVNAPAEFLKTAMECQPVPSWMRFFGVPTAAAVMEADLGLHVGEDPGAKAAQFRPLTPVTFRS